MVDQRQRRRERRGDLRRDLELGGVAALDPDPGDHDAALVEHDLADPPACDLEVHPPPGEGRSAADPGERRHGLEVAQRQIVEGEAARDDVLGHRALLEVARLDPDRRFRLGDHACGDVLGHPLAGLAARLERPVQLEVARGHVLRLDLGP